jgi:hypothetical protein
MYGIACSRDFVILEVVIFRNFVDQQLCEATRTASYLDVGRSRLIPSREETAVLLDAEENSE